MSMTSRYPQLRKKLADAVHVAPATADAAEPMSGYVDKLRRHAYRVRDDDIERLCAAGYSEEQIFEVTIAAALGAGDTRLNAGLSALNEAVP